MGTVALAICLSTFQLLFLPSFVLPSVDETRGWASEMAVPQVVASLAPQGESDRKHYDYKRFAEVEKECRPLVSSSSELKLEHATGYDLKDALWFSNGDWNQEEGTSPLMPFFEFEPPSNDSGFVVPPLQSASFYVTNIDPVPRFRNMINVSGVLTLAMTRELFIPDGSPLEVPDFIFRSRVSQLRISFEGIYAETENQGGERVLCMLGMSKLPSRGSAGSFDSASSYNQPIVLEDDKLLLVIHYPRTLNLATRAIQGEMRSLHDESSLRYFDKVHFSSLPGASPKYEFGAEELIAKACNPYPFPDGWIGNQIDTYRGPRLCDILNDLTYDGVFTFLPNWKCNDTDAYCRKLGPFKSRLDINATDGGFNNVRLLIQDLKCEHSFSRNKSSSARVSAVLRVISSSEDRYIAQQRTGISGSTLSTEGLWNSSNGQLCMVGCLGLVNTESDGCTSRICLYISTTFSITKRSPIIGSISEINHGTDSFFPLVFKLMQSPGGLYGRFNASHLSYKYSKIELAGAFLERSEPFDFSAVVKKSLLSYPILEDGKKLYSLSRLSEDLSFHTHGMPNPLPHAHFERPFLEMDVFFLDHLFGRQWMFQNVSLLDIKPLNKPEPTEGQLLLNVSAGLRLSGKAYANASLLFLEGLYDPIVGKMYLIGCRDVRASWSVLFNSMDLEDGMDCLIEVKIEYPPTTSRWLANPTARVFISSQRNEDDPLHFRSIQLTTLPLPYQKQREDILSRRGVEGVLRIVTLSIVIACILSQLFYMRDNIDVVPFVSQVMLGVQALGYSLPLITGAEALFAQRSESFDTQPDNLQRGQPFQTIAYLVKLLLLVAFLLTLRLLQKVWKSRIKQLTRTPLEPRRVPSDKLVVLYTLIIHVTGFLVVHFLHGRDAERGSERPEELMDFPGWERELEEYIGLSQDFFILPQIIGNFLWGMDCKPLREAYYVGLSLLRLLPHLYDYNQPPLFRSYFSDGYEFVNPTLDFYSKFGDIAIPVATILLSCILYIQQRWGYLKRRHSNTSMRKNLPMGSQVYERLPSVPVEAELVSAGGDEVGRHGATD